MSPTKGVAAIAGAIAAEPKAAKDGAADPDVGGGGGFALQVLNLSANPVTDEAALHLARMLLRRGCDVRRPARPCCLGPRRRLRLLHRVVRTK